MILAQGMDQEVDLGRMLSMAILHDMPEAITGDIPTPSWRFMPPGSKLRVEREAIEKIFDGSPLESRAVELWLELQRAETLEARIVHDADLIDMYLQATVYAEQSGNQLLQEFWEREPNFNLPISRQIYEELAVQFKEAISC